MPHLRSDNDVRRGEKKTGFARCRGIFMKGEIASFFVGAVVINVVDVVVVVSSAAAIVVAGVVASIVVVALTVVVDKAASVAPTVLSVAVSIDASPSFNSAVAIVVVFFGKSSSSSTIVIFQQLVPALLELSFPQFSKL